MPANFIHHYLLMNKFMNTAGSGFVLFVLPTSELLNRLIKTTVYIPEMLQSSSSNPLLWTLCNMEHLSSSSLPHWQPKLVYKCALKAGRVKQSAPWGNKHA